MHCLLTVCFTGVCEEHVLVLTFYWTCVGLWVTEGCGGCSGSFLEKKNDQMVDCVSWPRSDWSIVWWCSSLEMQPNWTGGWLLEHLDTLIRKILWGDASFPEPSMKKKNRLCISKCKKLFCRFHSIYRFFLEPFVKARYFYFDIICEPLILCEFLDWPHRQVRRYFPITRDPQYTVNHSAILVCAVILQKALTCHTNQMSALWVFWFSLDQ